MRKRSKKASVNSLVNGVKKFLVSKYGAYKSEWDTTLLILEDTLTRYEEVKLAIEEVGIYDKASGKKNMLLSTEKDLVATLMKISQKLGISPWDDSKIRIEAEDDTEDFLKGLTDE